MAIIYSRAAEYAIRALTRLSREGGDAPTPVHRIAEAEGLPAPFLAKIVQDLARAGIIHSLRGRKGGIRLLRPPSQITLAEIVDAVDGLDTYEQCAVGMAVCRDDTPCPIHDRWKPLRQRIVSYLHGQTLARMARAVEQKLG